MLTLSSNHHHSVQKSETSHGRSTKKKSSRRKVRFIFDGLVVPKKKTPLLVEEEPLTVSKPLSTAEANALKEEKLKQFGITGPSFDLKLLTPPPPSSLVHLTVCKPPSFPCSICQSDHVSRIVHPGDLHVDNNRWVSVASCGHCFHYRCIEHGWLRRGAGFYGEWSACPECE